LAGAGPAAAQDPSVTRAEAARLATAAATDDGALRSLRAVRSIDGRPVDLRAVVDAAGSGSARARRLELLSRELRGGSGSAAVVGRQEAQRSARRVLDQGKYRERDLPKPFRGPLRWAADRLAPVGRFLDRTVGGAVRAILALPGGEFILLALLGAVVAWLAWLVARRTSRAAVAAAGHGGGLVDPSLDPEELDRRSDASADDGRWADAVRLRYEAGLIRLVRSQRLVLRPDTTAADAARQVDLPAMHAATRTFEAVVYGGRPATLDDVAEARRAWPDIVGAGSRR
jgi:hypothetical protein